MLISAQHTSLKTMSEQELSSICVLTTQRFTDLLSHLSKAGYEALLTSRMQCAVVRDRTRTIVLRATNVGLHEYWVIHADAGVVPDCYLTPSTRPIVMLDGPEGSTLALNALAQQLCWVLQLPPTPFLQELRTGSYEHVVGAMILRFGHVIQFKRQLNS